VGDAQPRPNLWRAYVSIARPDHWFKNVFALPGFVIALTVDGATSWKESLVPFALVVAGLCLVSSSNYVINELLDAPTDREHPEKRTRPAASGLVKPGPAIALWLALGGLGCLCAWVGSPSAIGALAALWGMGVVYNVPPLRSKEQPYVDVLSEAVNNPLRLWAGWAATGSAMLPPLSLVLSYWMLGAFFMAVKRLAEYRQIKDPVRASRYRRSFAFYTSERLLVSVMAYAAASAMFAGVFITRYRFELILAVPLVAVFYAYYLDIGLRPDSAAVSPENLYRDWRFAVFAAATFGLCLVLLVVDLPSLPELFTPTIPTWSPDQTKLP